jgi:hypothetical protein
MQFASINEKENNNHKREIRECEAERAFSSEREPNIGSTVCKDPIDNSQSLNVQSRSIWQTWAEEYPNNRVVRRSWHRRIIS